MLKCLINGDVVDLTSPKINFPLKSLLNALYNGGVDFLSVNNNSLYRSLLMNSL